ncbi:hypothetical protein N657DRAFT_569617 [Parathielavia appendiculata]|uniref:Uncharacterized protein n=1 Tax=Parathielavia appendiculata TaxID=2587402 RepID=A0AAN6U4Y6_9PEZI|nr:hypothetical protein N657DRAFT_569617 [Parathielavia appendiculata]
MHFTTPCPAHHQLAMDTIVALGDLTDSSSYSESTDVDMAEADWTGHGRDELLVEIPCRPSIKIESDDDASLRGGVVFPRQTVAWARKVAVVPPRKHGYDEAEFPFEFPDPGQLSDDDGYSTSSDWDSYGALPLTMSEYDSVVARLEGSEDWNADQRKLHKLLYMRGLHPMIPSWWRVSLKMWGITQPHLDDVFTPRHSKKRVAIHAYGNEVAATKALESLFYLSQTVSDYEEIGYQSKITSTAVKGIRSYIKWALRDAGIDNRRSLLNMLVQGYTPDFHVDDDSQSGESDFAPSPVSSNEDGDRETADAVKAGGKRHHQSDAELEEAQRALRFTRAVSRDLERRLLGLGQRWRERLRQKRGGKGFVARPPTLYAFAVIQHIVMLASYDSGSATDPVVVLEQVRLNERGQWLWNALSLALPVNMARDALNGFRGTSVVVERREEDWRADPDL